MWAFNRKDKKKINDTMWTLNAFSYETLHYYMLIYVLS